MLSRLVAVRAVILGIPAFDPGSVIFVFLHRITMYAAVNGFRADS
jgi:hypothetical protein